MSYNAAIPQPTDPISQSQNQILTNFSQANIAIGVDHTALDVALNQGKHKKSTYVEQTLDPATAANEMAIYSKDVAGVTTEFLRKESNGTVIAMSGQDPVRAGGGTSFLPGDATRAIIVKWGDCGTVTPAGTPVGFLAQCGSDFPTACFQVFVTVTQNGSNSTRTVTTDVTSYTAAGFTAYSSNNVNARFFAIGN